MFEPEELILKNPKKTFVKPHHKFNEVNATPCFYKIVNHKPCNNATKLSAKERNISFKKEFKQLKTKVALNWCKLLAIGVIFAVVSYFILAFAFKISLLTALIYAASIGVITPAATHFTKPFKLFITRFDKENIYAEISKKLLAQKK